jgi:phosphosulfolactate synthase (CoM biosynthesis protein A)
MQPNSGRGFSFLKISQRPGKPRARGITELRGPYYTPMGKRYLQNVLETMGAYVDSLKFAGGSFVLMPPQAVRKLIDLLFVDHSQIVQLECLRTGIWGTSSLWGRVHTYKDPS